MRGSRGRHQHLSPVFFFLKTFFFNPLNNPVFVVLFFFVVFFYWEGSLDKYHVAMIMYLALLSQYFLKNMLQGYSSDAEETTKAPLIRFFKALPITSPKIYSSYLLSAVVYVLLIYVLLGLLLLEMMKLPDLKGMQFIQSVAPDGDTVTTLTGYALSRRGIPYFVSLDWSKSLLFDSILKIGGGKFWTSLYAVLIFIYISVLRIFQQMRPKRGFQLVILFHKLPLGIFLLLGLVFIADLILTQNEIGIYSRLLIQSMDVTLSLFLVVFVATVFSTVSMSKVILARLKGY